MTGHLRPARAAAAPLLLAVVLTGCGASDAGAGADAADTVTDAATDGEEETGAGAVAGACLEGSVDCDDTPDATGTGGVESGADGSVPVGEAVAAGVQGPFLMSGYLVSGPDGVQLCELLAESFPPQCGGTSVLLEPDVVPADAVTSTEGDVTWSSETVLVEGELVDGTFVVRTG